MLFWNALLLLVVLGPGCSGDAREQRRPRREDPGPRPPQPSYEVVPVVNGGTITGLASWIGERPAPVSIPVALHAEHCGAEQPSPALEIGRRGGVVSTVVWLEGVQRGRGLELPPAPLEVALEGCAVRPHVLVAPLGARVSFRNAEALLHNVHARFWRPGGVDEMFSHGLPELGATHEVTLERAGIVRVVDDAAHPWMLGWLHVFSHPYFAVSDEDGRFHIAGIPPGQYVLRAWHEGFLVRPGETDAGRPIYSSPIVLTRPVTVTAGHDTTVDFAFDLAAATAAGD